MKKLRRIACLSSMALLPGLVLAQGALTPESGPAPSMKTLQQIWEKIDGLEGTVAAQQTALSNQVAQLAASQQVATQQVAALQQRLTDAGLNGALQETADMVLIPAGPFRMGNCMGSAEVDSGESPVHTVILSAYWIDKYEVTSARWDDVANWGDDHSYNDLKLSAAAGKAAAHPVQMVNWYDCLKYCNARSAMEGRTPCYTNANGTVYRNGEPFDGGCNWAANGYRLPTEAEWEKAARGGVAGHRFPWADAQTISHSRGNYNSMAGVVYDEEAGAGYHPDYDTDPMPYTSPVGAFASNGYGLYDMDGNVREWCWDWYSESYYGSSPASDPHGPSSGSYRVGRGGRWVLSAYGCRVAYRGNHSPDSSDDSIGFRTARAAP